MIRMKMTNYLFTSPPDDECMISAIKQLTQDIDEKNHINQCFFYGDSVTIATTKNYSHIAEKFIDLAESQQIPLYICAAALQKRQLTISPLGQQDFASKGLGQFIEETKNADHIYQF